MSDFVIIDMLLNNLQDVETYNTLKLVIKSQFYRQFYYVYSQKIGNYKLLSAKLSVTNIILLRLNVTFNLHTRNTFFDNTLN